MARHWIPLALILGLMSGCGKEEPPATSRAEPPAPAATDSITVLSLLWDRHPGHVPVAQRLGQLCELAGRTEEALGWWTLARNADAPDNRPAYWLDLARLQHGLGRDSLAAACLDSLLDVRPDWPEALYNLGALCVNTGDPAGARHHWTRMLALDPDHGMAGRVRNWLDNQP